jgi:tetratricopeptide (TPR) repeat protein
MKRLILMSVIAGCMVLISCKHHGKGSTKPEVTNIPVVSSMDPVKAERIAHNKRVYEMAARVHDSYTQLNALYNIMADDTTNNLKNMDSVAEIYLKLNMGLPAMKMAEKILEKQPENEKMLELKAEGDMGLAKFDEALNINRKLYDKTKKLKYLFDIANVQLQQGKMKDLDETLNSIKTSPNYQTDSIEVADNQSGTLQKVPSPAVMSYIEAMLSYRNKDIKGMYAKLKQAVTIFPDYINANRDIQAIMQQSQKAQQ